MARIGINNIYNVSLNKHFIIFKINNCIRLFHGIFAWQWGNIVNDISSQFSSVSLKLSILGSHFTINCFSAIRTYNSYAASANKESVDSSKTKAFFIKKLYLSGHLFAPWNFKSQFVYLLAFPLLSKGFYIMLLSLFW